MIFSGKENRTRFSNQFTVHWWNCVGSKKQLSTRQLRSDNGSSHFSFIPVLLKDSLVKTFCDNEMYKVKIAVQAQLSFGLNVDEKPSRGKVKIIKHRQKKRLEMLSRVIIAKIN